MQAVIMAGGRGTRLAGAFPGLPKPLVPVCGKPVLLWQIEALKAQGVTDITLMTGYLAQQIEDAFGAGEAFGVRLTYYREETPLGTAGALYRLPLKEDFLLLNGDLIFDFDLPRMLAFHKENDALATLFAHPNNHPSQSTLIETDAEHRVLRFLPKERRSGYHANLCNAGIQLLSPELLRRFPHTGTADLDRDLLRPAIGTGRVFAYKSYEYARDMGTPAWLRVVEKDVAAGTVAAKNREKKQKAVFLDRDGTLNVKNGFITDPGQLELLPGAAAAVKKINEAGFLAVLATNQPVIARGECTEETLREIHNKLETLLGDEGAYLDAIYCCPHHPDGGYPGEVPELKIKCDCRKPAPGLLLRAAEEMNVDLAKSYMAGDSWRDIHTAANAGCTPVFIGETLPENAPAGTLQYPDLAAFAATIE
ncbi:MAG: HAD-IIIA family hydrolase [Clostridia bacterium]|nr:HAD-IIIA family hydrolase [Clostridia bacterium]